MHQVYNQKWLKMRGLNQSRSQGWVSSLRIHFVRGNSAWSRTQLSQPSLLIFCRVREGCSASAYVIHILGRFPSQLKGFFLLPKPLLRAGAQPGEVAHTEGRPWAHRVWHTALNWVQENEAATCSRAEELEEAWVEVKKRWISVVVERWECMCQSHEDTNLVLEGGVSSSLMSKANHKQMNYL